MGNSENQLAFSRDVIINTFSVFKNATTINHNEAVDKLTSGKIALRI
jgi:hypothetical protein